MITTFENSDHCKRLDKNKKRIVKRLSQKACFHLLVKSNDEKVLNEESWSLAVDIDEERSLYKTLTKLRDRSQHSAFTSDKRIFDHLDDDMQYYLESRICFDRNTDPEEQVVLKIKPEFHPNIDKIKLSWYLT